MAPEHRAGEPLEQNWISREGSREFARLVDYRDAYEPGARRFDMGQRSSFQLIPMAIAALEQLLEWQVPRIAATLAETTAKIADCATAIGLRALPADCRGPHMLGIDLPDEVRGQVPEALAAAGCYAAVRSGSLRVAPHLHNTPEEIARLISALDSALRR